MRESKFIILKDKEFAVLSALGGIHHFFGSIHLEKPKLDEQELYKVLYGLYQKSWLVFEGERTVIHPEILHILERLSKAERLMSIVQPMTLENHAFYYSKEGEECIQIQKCWEDPKSIWIRSVEKTDIIPICKECELLPKQILDKKLMEGISLDVNQIVNREYLEIGLYNLETDTKEASINVRMEGLNDVMTYSDEEKDIREIYILERLEEMIETLLQDV